MKFYKYTFICKKELEYTLQVYFQYYKKEANRRSLFTTTESLCKEIQV